MAGYRSQNWHTPRNASPGGIGARGKVEELESDAAGCLDALLGGAGTGTTEGAGCRVDRAVSGATAGNGTTLDESGTGVRVGAGRVAGAGVVTAGESVGCSLGAEHPESTVQTLRDTLGITRGQQRAFGTPTWVQNA